MTFAIKYKNIHKGGLGVIIESNLNRVRLSCCWVGVGLGCDNIRCCLTLSINIYQTWCDLVLVDWFLL